MIDTVWRMAYRIRSIVGTVLAVAFLGLALFALFQLIRGGSCASGGNYVSTRQCPPGTGTWAAVLPLAIIATLASAILGRLRRESRKPLAVPFGLPATGDARQFLQHGVAPTAPTSDPVVRLALLQSLHQSGALTQAEFDAAKAKILGDM